MKKKLNTTRLIQPQSSEADYITSDLQNVLTQFERLADQALPPALITAASSSFIISKEVQEVAKGMIEKGFRNFADCSQQLADEIANFDKKREEVRKDIKRGARQTSGRII